MFLFADFRLDTATRQLFKGGEELHLSPKAFDLLALLLAERPGVVPKNTLRARLWPGTNVVDANLNNLVSEIRTTLGDDPQKPRFVRTVHRIGYAFSGSAEVAGAGDRDRVPAAAEPRKARAWLVWKDRTFPVGPEPQVLGRDPECAIWVDAPGVSRRHARIRLESEGSGAVLEDVGSTNGTFVDNRRVRGSIVLQDTQQIRLGEATLTFRDWGAAGAATKRIKRPR